MGGGVAGRSTGGGVCRSMGGGDAGGVMGRRVGGGAVGRGVGVGVGAGVEVGRRRVGGGAVGRGVGAGVEVGRGDGAGRTGRVGRGDGAGVGRVGRRIGRDVGRGDGDSGSSAENTPPPDIGPSACAEVAKQSATNTRPRLNFPTHSSIADASDGTLSELFNGMRNMIPCAVLSLVVLFGGCAPGSIEWATGSDSLRTALFQTSDASIGSTRLLLSTGQFGCDFPAEEDPNDLIDAQLAIVVGACREDARHLAITTFHDAEVSREGRYIGQDDAATIDLATDNPRIARVDYVGIEEAVLTTSDLPQFNDALGGTYRPTDVTQAFAAGNGGRVQIRESGDDLTGSYDFPSLHVSGRFRAVECPVESPLFNLAFTSPTASCP
ncbi:MAG: hypothetical protein ACJATT_004838 [Myxococcota bacterium]|jgi:hypothetical protein